MNEHDHDWLALDWKARARARAWERQHRRRVDDVASGIIVFICLAILAWLAVYG